MPSVAEFILAAMLIGGVSGISSAGPPPDGRAAAAESALSDGLYSLAWNEAGAVFQTTNFWTRYRAFNTMMSVLEQQNDIAAMQAVFETGKIGGLPLRNETRDMENIIGHWQSRARTLAAMEKNGDKIPVPVPPEISDPTPHYARLRAYAFFVNGEIEKASDTLAPHAAKDEDAALDLARILLRTGQSDAVSEILTNLAVSATARLLDAHVLAQSPATVTNAVSAFAGIGADMSVSADIRAVAFAEKALALSRFPDRAEEALTAAESALRLARSPLTLMECEMLLAIVAGKIGDNAKAITTVVSLATGYPTSVVAPNAAFHTALFLSGNGNDEAALEIYDIINSSFENPPDISRERAKTLSRLKRHAESAATWKSAGHDSDFLIAAEEEVLAGKPDAALSTLRLLLSSKTRLSAKTAAAASLREAQLVELTDADAAFGLYCEITESDTDIHHAAHFGLARLAPRAAAAGETPAERDAFALAHYALAAESDDAGIRTSAKLGAGFVHLRAGRHGEAIKIFDETTEDDRAILAKADALLLSGDIAAATRTAAALAAPDSESPMRLEAAFWMGRRHFNFGEFAEAKKWFAECAGKPDALYYAAVCDYETGDFQSAAGSAAQLDTPRANLLRADALAALMRFADALPLYDAALATADDGAPSDEAAALRRADCLFTLGSGNAAEAYSNIWHTASSPATAAQCAYKIGRGLEKSGAADAALKHYYETLVAPFDEKIAELRNCGIAESPDEKLPENEAVWYSRAFFDLSELLTAAGERAAAAKILRRITDNKLPGAAEAARRVERLAR